MKFIFNLTISIAALITTQATAEINNTTSYYKQNQYYCTLATQDYIKPAPQGRDHFLLHDIHRGIVDLYGDGTIDMVFGSADETFSSERYEGDSRFPAWVYEGNEERSRKPHQYSFYSPDPDFVSPSGTRYLNARTIMTQDFNGDNIDDLAFAIWGTDYEPYLPMKNEILLSSPDGYEAKFLSGAARFSHGGSAGDIDNDGDVDLLITGASPDFSHNLIYRYINNGLGDFKVSTVPYLPEAGLVTLWDIDSDGNLDVFLETEADRIPEIRIYWGKGDGGFERMPLSISDDLWISKGPSYSRSESDTYTRHRDRGFYEPAFLDSDSDGKLNIIIPSNMDFHFSLFDLELSGREVDGFKEVFRTIDAANSSIIPNMHWVNACDLGGAGTDLVFEIFGQPIFGNNFPGATLDFSRTDKIVFKNDGNGNFKFFKLESPLFFGTEHKRLLTEYAQYLGVSIKYYEPNQMNFPNIFNEDSRFFHPSYEERRMGAQYLPFNTLPEITTRLGLEAIDGVAIAASTVFQNASSNQNTTGEVSDKVRQIILDRQSASQEGTENIERDESSIESHSNTAPSSAENDLSNVSDRVRQIIIDRRSNSLPDVADTAVKTTNGGITGAERHQIQFERGQGMSDRLLCIFSMKNGDFSISSDLTGFVAAARERGLNPQACGG